MLEALVDFVPGVRLLIAVGSGRFAKSVADGARRAAERLGLNVVGTIPHAEVPDDPTRQADVVRSLRAAVIASLRAESTSGHVEYPTAQAYAACQIAMRCVEEAGTTQDAAVQRVAREFRCTTVFGRFGLGEDGRQQNHEMLSVQWQEGMKRVVAPPFLAETDLRLS